MNFLNGETTKRQRIHKILHIIGLLLIFGIAVYLRFINLRSSPGWYTDEGVFINFAENLLHGKWQIIARVGSPMWIQRPLLFIYVLAGAFRLFGADILILRTITAFYGSISVILLYFFIRDAFGSRLALISAFIAAVFPWMVAFNRFGFTYNQLAPLMLFTVYSCWKISDGKGARWLILASLSSALALATDYLGIVGPFLVFIVLFAYRKKWLLPGLLFQGVVFFLILLPSYLANPSVFWSEISVTYGIKISVSPLMQIVNIVLNSGELIRRNAWIVFGLAGLLLLPKSRAKTWILFVVCLTLLLIFRSVSPVGSGMHYLIHIFPFICIGIGAFFSRGIPKFLGVLNETWEDLIGSGKVFLNSQNPSAGFGFIPTLRKIFNSLMIAVFVLSPIVWMVLATVAQSAYGTYIIFSGNDDMGLSASADVDRVVAFLGPRISENDLVLGSPQIIWAVPAVNKTEWEATLVFDLPDSGAVPAIPKERFGYNCSLSQTSYVIVDPLARGFVQALYPGMKDIIQQVERWPLVFTAGEIDVYQNPRYQ